MKNLKMKNESVYSDSFCEKFETSVPGLSIWYMQLGFNQEHVILRDKTEKSIVVTWGNRINGTWCGGSTVRYGYGTKKYRNEIEKIMNKK